MSVPQKTLEPPLRFPEFSGAWEDRRLGEQASFLKGKSISKADICENGEVSCIRYGELYTTYGEVITSTVSKTNLAINDLILSQRNDVIIPASGETALDIATASCVTLDGIALSGDINIIRSKMDGRFLAYILSHSKKLNIARLAQGNSVVHLYKSQLESLLIVIPKHPEQKKIADYLGAVDAKLRLLERRRDALRNYKKGMMQRIFSQEIRFTQDDGTAFPDWQKRSFCDFAGKSNSRFNPLEINEQPVLIEMDNLLSDGRGFTGESVLSTQQSIKNVFCAGEILFGKLRPYLNKFARPDFDGVCSSEIWVLQGKSVENNFLYYLIQTSTFFRSATQSSGSKMPRSDWLVVGQAIFNIPTHPEEQQKIADFLGAIDTKITAVEGQIATMQDFKKSMLQQMFV